MDVNLFQEHSTIDPTRLDMECVLQPERFFHWAQKSIEASVEVDRAKLRLEVVKAKLELECRQAPETFGLIKATEAGVDAAVKFHQQYIDALEAHLEAKKDAKLLEAAVNTMEQKKRMIEVLITLHGQQYFAGPSVPRDLVADWMEHQQKSEDEVQGRQKTKLRQRKGKA